MFSKKKSIAVLQGLFLSNMSRKCSIKIMWVLKPHNSHIVIIAMDIWTENLKIDLNCLKQRMLAGSIADSGQHGHGGWKMTSMNIKTAQLFSFYCLIEGRLLHQGREISRCPWYLFHVVPRSSRILGCHDYICRYECWSPAIQLRGGPITGCVSTVTSSANMDAWDQPVGTGQRHVMSSSVWSIRSILFGLPLKVLLVVVSVRLYTYLQFLMLSKQTTSAQYFSPVLDAVSLCYRATPKSFLVA